MTILSLKLARYTLELWLNLLFGRSDFEGEYVSRTRPKGWD